MRYWTPILERHKVDLVLQGHDHTYARGRFSKEQSDQPVYVVTISGEKMYTLADQEWMDRKAENTQLYQLIHVSDQRIEFESFMPNHTLYDHFTIEKDSDGNKTIMEKGLKTPERRFSNTKNEIE
jgi:hypothetical protein